MPKAKAADGKARRKEKKVKDPNRPKRATTAFFFFSKDKREETKAQHPTAHVTEIAKFLSEKWKVLSEGEKAYYENQAKMDKARYEREIEEYKSRQGIR